MNKFTAFSAAAAIATALFSTSTLATEPTAAAVKLSGEKLDNGLGDLPHYSQWADPSGKNPLRAKASTTRGDKTAQRAPVQVSQAK
jgi:hypothetical protein